VTQQSTQELVYEFVLPDPESLLVETWVRGGRQVYRYSTGGRMWSEDLDAGPAVAGPIAAWEQAVTAAIRIRLHPGTG
jgi:hypothetical protein